jgi:hypothetical protein
MEPRLPYAEALDAVGLYVERADGADVFVNELETGFLVSFLVEDEQRVSTLSPDDLARLRDESRRRGLGGLFRKRENGQGTRTRLRAVGRHLDAQVLAAAVVAQERADGYAVDYTGLFNPKDDLSGLTRRHDELDATRLATLAR